MKKQEINKAVSAQDILCRGVLHKLLKRLTVPCMYMASVFWVCKLCSLFFMSWSDAGLRYDVFINSFTHATLILMIFDMWIRYTTKAVPIKR